MMNEKYCPRIYHGLTLSDIRKQDMKYAVCCWAQKTVQTTDVINFHHPDFADLRTTNAQGHLPGDYCRICIEQEKTDKKSMRLGYVETHGEPSYDPTLQYLDVNIDYTCNLACVTCGPELSTTWRNELKIKNNNIRPNLGTFISYLDKLDLSQLREVRLWGGEPFLTNTHVRVLEHILSHGRADQVKLMYNTNGTCRISDDVKRLIEKFKFARISFSIDGIGDRFEYLRYPAKWSAVEDNLLWWRDNLPHNSMLSLTVTASIMNILHLGEVYQWHREKFSQSCFGDPIEVYVHQAFGQYGLEHMPDEMIKHFRSLDDYCQPWIQELDILGTKQHKMAKISELLKEIDQRRGLDFGKIFPEVAGFIGYTQ